MTGTTIHSVKAVGLCSKHKDREIMRYKDGTIIPDKDIECIACNF